MAGNRSAIVGSAPGQLRRFVVLIIAGLALLLQSLLVQTHLHRPFDGGAHAAVRLQAVTHAADGRGSGGDPQTCPLCRELAFSGHYVTPAAPLLLVPPSVFAGVPAGIFVAAVRLRRSHSWQSRGPPPLPGPDSGKGG